MKTKSLLVLGAIIIMHLSVKAQVKIGTNPTSINSNSLLELESGTQGFVLPRVSIGDVSAASPLTSTMITGTIVYNTNSTTTGGSGTGIYLWDGTKWVFISTGTAVSSSAWLLTGNSGLSSSTNFIGTTDAIDFVVRTANTERMRILGALNGSSKAGWIGMGVTVPRSSLDVAGDYTNKNVITIQNTSSTGFSSIDMLNNSGSLVGTFGYANSGTGGNFASKTYFNSYANDFFLTRGSSYDFVMKGSNGYIGLNTATPSERLHVVGNIYLNGAFMPGGNAGTLGYVLTSAGVGVSPTWKRLDSLSWSLTGNGGSNYLTNFLGTTDNVSMRFRTNNVQRMIIDSLGKVGIGLTNPAYALSVLSASNPLYLSGVQATTTFAADSILTINAGIVKKTPYSTLNNVSWNLLGNSSTNSSVNFLGTTDNHPMKFKVNNTIAGFIDSSGGLGNTYFGSNAGYSNTTGSGNTLTGSGADSANSTGTSNTAFGYQAGYNNTSGGSNTFTGYQSGYSNTTSSGNLFSGYQAGYKNTTGQLNMFSGYWTGYSNTTGSNNVFTGYLSGFGNTTGGNNIFIGSQAGSTNTTGSRNTLIGGNSNVLTAGLFNAAAIGYSAKVGLSNSLVLGDTISGGNAVNVGIGVRYPLKRLHIDAAPISIFATGTQDSLKIDNLASSSSAYNKAILVIDSATGYVSKQNLSNLSSNINWSLTGNSGTNYATNFLGTTDSVSMRFRTANTQRMIIDSLGHVGIGSSNFDPFNPGKLLVDYGVTSSNTMANFKGSVDDYFQINLKNNSNGGNASTDYVATADDGTDSTYYVDMGINSSNYAFAIDNWGQAHDAYLYSNSKNLYIGTQASGSDVIFLVGGGRAVTNAALRIRGNTGNIVVGKGDVSTTPIGNVLRGPNGFGTNIAGGNLTIQGGAGTGTATAGNLSLNGGITSTGTNGIINLSTSSTERMRIDASGNVGIGTTNPSNLLSIIAASNPLYLAGVQATSTFNSDSILTINAGIVKKTPYSSFSSATTNTLVLNTNTLTSTVNGVAATSTAVSGVSNTSSTNTLSTTVNGVTGLTVSIINSNAKTWTQSGGLTTIVNGVSSNVTPATGTVSNVLGYNAAGAPVYQSASGILSGATTNTLALSGNTLTSTVNGVAATSNSVSSVSNTSSANTLSTTVNGVAGTAANIINTNTNALTQAGGLVTTVNGVAATTSIASGTISNLLGYNSLGTAVYQPLSNVSLATAWNVTGNTGTSSLNFLGNTDNVSLRFRTNNTERMIIDSLGKVGIGTSTPASTLTLYQSAGSGNSKGFTFTGNSISSTNSGTGFLMSLGYNTPGNKQLWFGDGDYAGNASGSFARFVQTGTVFPVMDAVSGDGASRRYLAFGVAGDPNSGIIFGADNTGISPGSQVWDNGNMAIGAGYKSAAAPSNGLLVQGSLGIGTTAPSSALSIIAASNPIYVSGLTALTSLSSSDSVLTINAGVVKKVPNTLLGSGASSGWSLAGNNISAATGSFLGTTSANALVFKYNSTSAGYLDANNTAFGTSTTATGGSNNTAIGYLSTAANSATAVGASANAANVANTAIGNNATANGSDHETAIGASSQATAQYNTALGYNAQAKTGAYATAIGTNSLSTGAQSIALGTGTNSSADQTVSLGYNAQASGQFGVAIGNSSIAQASNSIAIGSNASINQSNSMLLGSVSTANFYVGIGTASPTAKLHIVGNSGGGYNPLQISGLPAGVSGTDNLLSINSSGVVGYITPATFNSSYWNLNGNAAAAGSYLGTTNTTPLQFKFNSTLAGYLDANNTAFGTSSTSTAGSNNTAIGFSATASNSSTAVGANASATNANNIAVGNGATANNSVQETALGASATANAQYNTAVGYNAQAISNSQATAIGNSALANATQSTALGYNAQAISNAQTTALGVSALANSQYNTAVGYNAQAINNPQATAIGVNSKATSTSATAVGFNAQAVNNAQTTAIGSATQATGYQASAFGYNAQAINAQTLAAGVNAAAAAQYGSSFGFAASSTGYQATAIGSNSSATLNSASAFGYNAQATNGQATAIGSSSLANQQNALALGFNAKAQASNAVAIGYNASTSQANALVLGDATNTAVLIGIGTATPTQKLDVTGNIRFSGALMPNNNAGNAGEFLASTGTNSAPIWFDASNYAWQLDGNPLTAIKKFGTTTNFDIPFITNNTERMRLTSGGLLGIGTTNPQQMLSVGSGMTVDQNNNNTGTAANALIFGSNSGEAIGSKRNAGGNQNGLDFYTSFNNRMVITNTGNVGINTTTPQNKLDVNGAQAIGSYAGTNTAPTNGLIVSGNVGVGTSAPVANTKLDVDGNFKLGDVGTVIKNLATGSGNVNFNIGSNSQNEFTINLSTTLTSTQGTAVASPGFDLPFGVSIVSVRISATNQVKVRVLNLSGANANVNGTIYVSATEF